MSAATQLQPTHEEILEAAEKAAKDELWRLGMLAEMKLHSDQIGVYRDIMQSQSSRYVLEIARRYGKTFLLALIAIEICLRNPKSRVVYGAPTLKHLEEFIIPTIEGVCDDAPEECRPKFNRQTGHFDFPNGSYIHLFGADDKRKADRGRGPKAKAAIFDECGFTPVLRYVLKSVMRPQLLRTKRELGTAHGMTLLGSTPAEEPEHDFTEIAERAEAQGNYARRTIHQNPLLMPDEKRQFMDDDAKEEGMTPEQYAQSDDFRREWMAERVVNKQLIVMGHDWELSREKSFKLYESLKRPDYFDGLTTLDFGGYDPHAALFGYWDFASATLVIEAELRLRDGENTQELQTAIKAVERDLWGTDRWQGTMRALLEPELLHALPQWLTAKIDQEAPQQPYARYCDNDIQLARDMYELHGIAFIPTAKDNKELAINNVRVLMRQVKVAINPDLVNLDRHLRGTVWKDHRRQDYRRRAGEHGDLLDCLSYKLRNVDRQRNPFPAHIAALNPEVRKQHAAKEAADQRIADAFLGHSPLGRKLLRRGR